MNKKLLGTTLATAAAIAFVVAPVTSFAGKSKMVHCYGANACKGTSSCKTSQNACKGKNSCKGKGVEMKTAKQCKKAGGSLTEPKS